jgi:hypothetical protein
MRRRPSVTGARWRACTHARARWLLDARRGATLVPLRAEVAGAPAPGTTWEVDGAPLEGDRWTASPGRHRFVAVWQGRRSDPVEVEVVETGGQAL